MERLAGGGNKLKRKMGKYIIECQNYKEILT